MSGFDHDSKEQQAFLLIKQGKLQEAEEIYREIIANGTRNHIIYVNLGLICLEKARYSESKSLLLQALKINPNFPDTYNSLGVVLKNLDDLDAAIAACKTSIKLNPNSSDAYYNLGNILKEKGDLNASITSYETALALNPCSANIHYNLGIALEKNDELDAAIASYQTALKHNPNLPDAHTNLGNILKEKGNLTAAIAAYNEALQLKPNSPDIHYNLSIAELLIGDYKAGWPRYEYRLECNQKEGNTKAITSCKMWNGSDLTKVSKVLLVSEQGLGDTLHFIRYAKTLRDRGINTSVCAQSKLHSLISASGIDSSPLTPQQANQVNADYWIPLLSVPRHLDVSPDNPVITEPYIRSTNELNNKWRDILLEEQKPVIGINWQGDPSHEMTSLKGRSLPLETFAHIASLTNVSLLSLQKGFGSDQMRSCSFKECFVTCQTQIDGIWDFLETAAIITNCDLIITSDTAIAHLAGGMGKPTWLLLKYIPEWRWGLEDDTTFWYPSMRLFRQIERGNWSEVIERVVNTLLKEFPEIAGRNSSKLKTPTQKMQQNSLSAKTLSDISAPISLGELIDKITILQIKTQHMKGIALDNVKKELGALESKLMSLKLNIDPELIKRLKEVNTNLWQIEDDIRAKELKNEFGESFIRLARSVYQQNDCRAAIKKEVNITYGSAFVEEKSYPKY